MTAAETANDLVYWKEPKISAGAIAVGLVYFIAVGLNGWSTLGFVCTTLAGILGVRLVYFKGRKLLADAKLTTPVASPTAPAAWVSEAEVLAHLTPLTARVNQALNLCFSLAYAEDATATAKCVGWLALVAWLAQLLSPTGLVFLLFVGAFSLPKFYELKQPQVDAALDQASVKAQELYTQAELVVKAGLAKFPKIPSAHDLKEEQEEKKKL